MPPDRTPGQKKGAQKRRSTEASRKPSASRSTRTGTKPASKKRPRLPAVAIQPPPAENAAEHRLRKERTALKNQVKQLKAEASDLQSDCARLTAAFRLQATQLDTMRGILLQSNQKALVTACKLNEEIKLPKLSTSVARRSGRLSDSAGASPVSSPSRSSQPTNS